MESMSTTQMSIPRVLFVPASGPTGSGEYYRCLAIARALQRRATGCEIHFVHHEAARVEHDPAFSYHPLADTPTRQTAAVLTLLQQLQPALVVFDSAGRMRQFRAARQAGAATVWISDRPNKRRRGFRLRAMRQFDLHLIAAPGVAAPRLSALERLKRRLVPGVAVRFFSGIAPEALPADRAALLESLGLTADGFLLFVAGGGGYHQQGRAVPEILVDAALEALRRTGLQSVVVMGPQYRGSLHHHEVVRIVPQLETEALGLLLSASRAAVIGAGSMMTTQALAAGVAVVLVPAGGDDQPARIRYMSAHGLALDAPLQPAAIAATVARLAGSAALRQQQAVAAEKHGLRNDVGAVADHLLQLID